MHDQHRHGGVDRDNLVGSLFSVKEGRLQAIIAAEVHEFDGHIRFMEDRFKSYVLDTCFDCDLDILWASLDCVEKHLGAAPPTHGGYITSAVSHAFSAQFAAAELSHKETLDGVALEFKRQVGGLHEQGLLSDGLF